MASLLRHDWTPDEIGNLYRLPFPDLLFQAQRVHREHHDPGAVQKSTLISVKTGGCSEDCAYCPQSAHYQTGVADQGLLPLEKVREAAKMAKASGSTRFCMGAAWREVTDGPEFDRVLDMVGAVAGEGLEVCCTLGMLTEDQARRLKQAGVYAYNHNLDSSPEFYGSIISTRTYEDRLKTLGHVREAGMTVCCGGILGMGESVDDRLEMLRILSSLDPHPESVPINTLVPVKGTPLEKRPPVPALEMARIVATARILMPGSMVRLSAGRLEMSLEAQALCFLAGANSIFTGEKLLTTPNPGLDEDESLLKSLGMRGMPARSPSP